MLVDELAHTNAPGSRHAKRWQDVEELLDAGIDVYTTLNVQHLESLNDVVAQITGVVVRETVPDSVLEQADEVELIDLPPDELLAAAAGGQGLRARAGRARRVGNFFRKGNLIALRELALRRTAERVDAQMQATGASTRSTRPGPRPSGSWSASARARRRAPRARRPAHGRPAAAREWIAAYVETPAQLAAAGRGAGRA